MNTVAASASVAAKTGIADMLPAGRQNAVSTAELCNILNVNVRILRQMVANERKSGAIILSDSSSRGGYYVPENREEVEECVRTLDAKARSIMVALRSARKYLKQSDGQMAIEG